MLSTQLRHTPRIHTGTAVSLWNKCIYTTVYFDTRSWGDSEPTSITLAVMQHLYFEQAQNSINSARETEKQMTCFGFSL